MPWKISRGISSCSRQAVRGCWCPLLAALLSTALQAGSSSPRALSCCLAALPDQAAHYLLLQTAAGESMTRLWEGEWSHVRSRLCSRGTRGFVGTVPSKFHVLSFAGSAGSASFFPSRGERSGQARAGGKCQGTAGGGVCTVPCLTHLPSGYLASVGEGWYHIQRACHVQRALQNRVVEGVFSGSL